jgi:hypothetical protein
VTEHGSQEVFEITGVEIVILILGAFRLTHLVVYDSITEPLRIRLYEVPFVGSMITCYWCAGMWVSAVVWLGYSQLPNLLTPVMIVLAIAGGQSLLETWVQGRE